LKFSDHPSNLYITAAAVVCWLQHLLLASHAVMMETRRMATDTQ